MSDFTLPEWTAISQVESSLPYGLTLPERRRQRAGVQKRRGPFNLLRKLHS